MIIEAKFASTCPACSRPIAIGSRVEWERGNKARHTSCSEATSQNGSAKQSASASQKAATLPVAGERTVTRESRGRDDGMTAGETVHMQHVSRGGGPDGHYWTVVADSSRYRDDDSDEWMLATRVRPATDNEAAPLAARISARIELTARISELTTLARAGQSLGDVACPAGRSFTIHAGVRGSGVECAILGDDGSVSLWASGHYDDYIRTCWVTRDPRAVEILTKLLPATS